MWGSLHITVTPQMRTFISSHKLCHGRPISHTENPQFVFIAHLSGQYRKWTDRVSFKIANQKKQRFIHTENTAYVNEHLNDDFSILFTPVKNVIQNVADIQTTKNREKKPLV
jgi:hypothetical protein